MGLPSNPIEHALMTSTRGTTRKQIFSRIQRAASTVEQLSAALSITPAAVRSQLGHLEREGLVVRSELLRKGAGQPAIVYRVAEGAEDAFSSAYKPLLVNLVDCLSDALSEKQLTKLMREAGRRVAMAEPSFGRTLSQRIETTVASLEELGASIDVEHVDCDIKITSYACPLATAVHCRPEVCKAVRAFIAEATACPVREQCKREQVPLVCEFVLTNALA